MAISHDNEAKAERDHAEIVAAYLEVNDRITKAGGAAIAVSTAPRTRAGMVGQLNSAVRIAWYIRRSPRRRYGRTTSGPYTP